MSFKGIEKEKIEVSQQKERGKLLKQIEAFRSNEIRKMEMGDADAFSQFLFETNPKHLLPEDLNIFDKRDSLSEEEISKYLAGVFDSSLSAEDASEEALDKFTSRSNFALWAQGYFEQNKK